MLKKLLILISILIISSPAFAVDPFLSDSEEDGTYMEEVRKTRDQADKSLLPNRALAETGEFEEGLKKQNSFNGTMDSLLQAAKPEEEKKAWLGFEEVEGTEAEAKFYQSSEYKVRSELSKPIEERKPFANRLDGIEKSLGANTQTNGTSSNTSNDDFFGRGE